jgi:hypothetical protein
VTSIPRALSDVDAAWLSEVLRAGGVLERAQVRAAELEPMAHGSSYVGSLARVRLELDREEPGAPGTLIAKLPAPGGPTRALGEASRGYERECRFYAELASDAPIPTPRAYASLCDHFPDERLDVVAKRTLEWLPEVVLEPLFGSLLRLAQLPLRRYVLLLEDLSDASPGDQLAGCDAATAEQGLRALARLHAHYWQSPDLDAIDWLRSVDETPRMFELLFRRGWPGFRDGPGRALPLDLERLHAWLEANARPLMRTLARAPTTLNHGDYRLDNLLFRDGRLAAVIDWQAVVRARGPLDVAYFLGGGLHPSLGAAVERGLVEGYHRGLLEGGVEGYAFEGCFADYELAKLLVLHRLVIAFDSMEMDRDARTRRLVARWYGRLAKRIRGVDLDEAAERLHSSGEGGEWWRPGSRRSPASSGVPGS